MLQKNDLVARGFARTHPYPPAAGLGAPPQAPVIDMFQMHYFTYTRRAVPRQPQTPRSGGPQPK